jgi:hypothetical protein
MKLPNNPLISEILQKVSNAKTKEEKTSLLRQYESPGLKALLIWNFDPSLKSCLPEGEVPYTANDAPAGTEHTRIQSEYRKFYHFIEGGDYEMSQSKKEVLFIQMIEALHQDEAEVLCLVKDKNLGKKYRITHNVIKEAFPTIEWGNRS